MPELPEVEVTRRGIEPYLKGSQIINLRLGKPLRWALGCASEQLIGKRIAGVRRRGKYLLLDLVDGGILLVHLGMSGSLRYHKNLPQAGKHDHFDLLTTQGGIRLHDPRRFGAVVWAPSQTQGMGEKLLGHLGMEPLEESFDAAVFAQQIKKRQAPIKQVLLTGNIVEGVGNIYACEVLYLSGIDPRRLACKISVARLEHLAKIIQQVLNRAIDYGGTTLKDFQAADGSHGLFQEQAQVYGRQGNPCAQCRQPIKCIKQGQRSTYFCAHCQK